MNIVSEQRQFLLIGKCKDITGQKFGKLTAIGLVEKHPRCGAKWLFRCDCGGEKVLLGSDVTLRGTKSCGCVGIGAKDLRGQKFGMLTAVSFVEVVHRRGAFWLFRCDCGNEKVIRANNVVHSGTNTCGCSKDGVCGERLYNIWTGMKMRCFNPNDPAYKNYGGRGISVCEEWAGKNSFKAFRDWALANGYKDDLTIDRIDNDLWYSPSNCRWVTKKEQNNNRRSNLKITAWGETKNLCEWSRDSRCSVAASETISDRLKRGMSPEGAIGLPPRRAYLRQSRGISSGNHQQVKEDSGDTNKHRKD
jgi:hypothetical protein